MVQKMENYHFRQWNCMCKGPRMGQVMPASRAERKGEKDGNGAVTGVASGEQGRACAALPAMRGVAFYSESNGSQ